MPASEQAKEPGKRVPRGQNYTVFRVLQIVSELWGLWRRICTIPVQMPQGGARQDRNEFEFGGRKNGIRK